MLLVRLYLCKGMLVRDDKLISSVGKFATDGKVISADKLISDGNLASGGELVRTSEQN